MKPTLEERILATGETLERVRQWESIIETIAAKTGEPKDDVASIVLRPLASGKVNLSDCCKLQEIGVRLSNYFMTHVASENAGSNSLFHELTQMGYNSEKKKKDFTAAWDYGIKLVTGKKADDAHRTVESDGTLKQNRNTDFKIHTAQNDSAPDKSQEQAMKPSDIQTAAYINKYARLSDIYEDKTGKEWRLTAVSGQEYGLGHEVTVWENPMLDRINELPAEGEPYSFVRNEPPVKEDGDEQPPLLPVIENKLEIYPNAVLIDGKQVRVRKDGVNINNYANREELMTVTLELMPSAVTIHPRLYKGTENRG